LTTQEAVAANPRAEAQVKSKGRFRFRTFSSLRYRDYRLLFLTVVCTSGGQWMEAIALGWLAYDMTGSAFMLGAINGMRAIPFLLLGPWGGVAADRMDRKLLMLVSQVWIMALAIGMTVLITMGLLEVWHLFAFTLLSGVGWVFTQPVRQTLIPSFVPREELANAVALQSAGFNATRIIGPSIAGILLASVGAQGAFGVKSVLYFGILALTLRMNIPPLVPSDKQSSPWESLTEGFKYIFANTTVLWLIVLALIPMILAFPLQSLMPVFAKDVLLQGPEGYGLLVSFMGIGAFTGTLTVASLGSFQRKGLLLMLSATGLGVAMILFSRSQWMPASLVLLMLVGGFQMTFMAMNNTLLHLNITDAVRGRVMSIYMLDQGLSPLGTLFAGMLASVAGAPAAATVIGVMCLTLSLIALKQVTHVRRLT
jgi:MFS family permease